MIDDSIYHGFIELDDHEVKDFLEALGEKKTQDMFRVQMKASARILQKKTIQNFMQKYNYQGVWKQEITRKSGKKKTKTRRVAKVTSKNKNGQITVKVHIMEYYKVKWLEMGTKRRTTKGRLNVGYYRDRPDAKRLYFLRVGKPMNRGSITPGKFFAKAISVTENPIKNDFEKRLTTVITKEME